jgi:hypothetical protein
VGVLHQHLVSHANVADSNAQAQDLEKENERMSFRLEIVTSKFILYCCLILYESLRMGSHTGIVWTPKA